MKKLLLLFLFLLLIIILVIGGALGVGIYNPRAYEGLINKLVFNKTGYQYITNDISIQVSPTIVTIQGLKLSNPEWHVDPALLGLGTAVISVDLKQLFNKQLPFWSASLSEVDVQLLENEQGQINWNTSILASYPQQEDKELLDFKKLLSFSDININKAILKQKKPNVEEQIDISSLLVERKDDSSIDLQGTGQYQQQNVNIKGSVDIDSQSPTGQILKFALQAQGLGIDLQTKGEVNPLDMEGAKVSLKANSDNLEKLEAFLETTLPAITPINVTMDLLSSNGNYELSKINLHIGENVLTGNVLFKTENSFLRVDLASEKIDLIPFVPVDNKKGVEAINAEVSTETEIDWAWLDSINSEISLDVGEISSSEYALKDVNALLKLSNGALEIDSLSARYQQQFADNTKPFFVSELVNISGVAKPLSKKTLGSDVQLTIKVTENDSSLLLEGKANLNGVDGNSLAVSADLSNLDTLSKYLQTDFSPYLPAKMSANIETSMHELSADNFMATSKQSDFSGNLKIDWSGENIGVVGELKSELFDATPLLIEEKNKQNKIKEGKIFSDEAIDWSWLDAYDAKLSLAINKLIFKENVFNKVKTDLEIGNGSLSINPLQALFANGSIKSVVMLNKFEDGVKFNAQLDAINLGLAAMGVTGDTVLEGGTTDVVLDFNGQGESQHQIMSSLNGEMVAEVQKGIIKNDAFEAIGTDIILEMFSMLNPFGKEDETTELECAAVKFTAENGVLTSKNQMAIETSKMKIVGGGIIDLKSEELEIGFSPSAKKGIGVNVGSLVKFVRLGGTLSNPHPEADPVGLLKSGAAIGAAVSTGGLSLLVEGLFKRAMSTGSACNQALQDVIEDADAQAAEVGAETSSVSKEMEKTE